MASETQTSDEIAAAVESLGPSEHLCMSYHTLQEALAVAVPFVRSGLDRQERCLYIAAETSRPMVVGALQSKGIRVDAATEAGSLSIVRGEDTPRRNGPFDAERMLAWVREQNDTARRTGFAGFRIVGEMTSVVGESLFGVKQLAEYEAKLDNVLSADSASALCVYDRHRFTGDIIRELIVTHPLVVVGTAICRNPLFVPPRDYLSPDWSEREIDWLLSNLRDHDRADRDLRAAEQRYRMLARRLLAVQEDERRRIARDLHDDLGQMLAASKMSLQAARDRPWGRVRRLNDSIALVQEAIERMRETTLDLRPPILDDFGLAPALRAYVDRQATRAGLAFHLDVTALDTVRLPASIETTCFRLVQEALSNVVRHARARRVDVQVSIAEHQVEVVVHDDGVGFDVAAARARAAAGASLGLLSMEERAALAGGGIEITSTPGQGTTVRARLPLD